MTSAKFLENPLSIVQSDMTDWGDVAHPIGDKISHESGILLFRRDDKSSEMGMWQCTPGRWRCEVEKDEFFHLLSGKAVYTSDSGEISVVTAGMVGAFPAGWKGECEVIETVRKVYMVR